MICMNILPATGPVFRSSITPAAKSYMNKWMVKPPIPRIQLLKPDWGVFAIKHTSFSQILQFTPLAAIVLESVWWEWIILPSQVQMVQLFAMNRWIHGRLPWKSPVQTILDRVRISLIFIWGQIWLTDVDSQERAFIRMLRDDGQDIPTPAHWMRSETLKMLESLTTWGGIEVRGNGWEFGLHIWCVLEFWFLGVMILGFLSLGLLFGYRQDLVWCKKRGEVIVFRIRYNWLFEYGWR